MLRAYSWLCNGSLQAGLRRLSGVPGIDRVQVTVRKASKHLPPSPLYDLSRFVFWVVFLALGLHLAVTRSLRDEMWVSYMQSRGFPHFSQLPACVSEHPVFGVFTKDALSDGPDGGRHRPMGSPDTKEFLGGLGQGWRVKHGERESENLGIMVWKELPQQKRQAPGWGCRGTQWGPDDG